MKTTLTITILLLSIFSFQELKAQVAINTTGLAPDTKSMFDITSTTSGLLIPRMTQAQRIAIAPIVGNQFGLLVYQTDVVTGYWFWDGAIWVRLYSGNGNAWDLLGNSGTTAGTNFIGTTDAQDFVIKTGVGGIERARILSGGNILLNRTTTLYATDLFEAQGNVAFPDAISGYTDQAAGSGVYGENSAANGLAVVGLNSAATGAGTGVGIYGQSTQTGAAGIWGSGSTFTRGMIGTTNNANYVGVQGQNAHIDGDGMYAVNTAASGVGGGAGIYARSDQSGGAGGWFATANAAGTGLIAVNNAAVGVNSGDGLYAQGGQNTGSGGFVININPTGTGLFGVGNNATGGYLVSGSGGAFTGSTVGSYSIARTVGISTGVIGVGNNVTANTIAASGSGGAFSGNYFGVYGFANYDVNNNTLRGGGYFAYGATNYAYVSARVAGTVYKIYGTGLVSTIVKNIEGNRVTLYAPESPDAYFTDYGSGQLVSGKAHINLDPIFSNNIQVDNNFPLRVFIQVEGECNGIYVTNKTKNSFDVLELKNGTSNVKFSYTIIGYCQNTYDESGNIISQNHDIRFKPAPGPMQTTKQEVKDRKIITLRDRNLNIITNQFKLKSK